ncbi:MAG TPA: diaminopimelate epimerase, partial [Gemmatimonadaceae bacterium]|nr:diaminopimelate epimerase [Gemmatimonadaceae bacterium]
SGNDFIFVDARDEPAGDLKRPDVIDALCARGTGIGADGIVFVEPPAPGGGRFSIRYLNRDGSLALLCGNASLCSVRLAAELGIVEEDEEFEFGTGAGLVRGRMTTRGPEIDLQPIEELDPAAPIALGPGERRLGFAMVGVPHVVVLCDDIEAVDVVGRGRLVRHHPWLRAGANVNFVAKGPRGWAYRTYERGVEAETLACGTGAVAAAALLATWGESGPATSLMTRSELPLHVTLRSTPSSTLTPSLNGEGRIVFRGQLPAELPRRIAI